jgi:hypothetical protein
VQGLPRVLDPVARLVAADPHQYRECLLDSAFASDPGGRLSGGTPLTDFADEACLEELIAALSGSSGLTSGSYDRTLCDGAVELRSRPLGGRAVCAAITVNGVLWVFIDPDKPDVLEQAQDMLIEWRGYARPSAPPEARP